METVAFLQKILPSSGVYYLCVASREKRGMAHRPFHSVADMASYIEKIKDTDHLTIYHACASYKEEFIEINGVKQYRKAPNRYLARSFWLDIDCGEDRMCNDKGERKGYAVKKDASTDIQRFCRSLHLPIPMIVDSGHGLHCYWVMDRDILPSEWIPVADLLASCLAHLKIYVDTSATRDFVRVLRPVGTTNRKPNKPDAAVKLRHDAKPVPFDYFKEALEDFVTENEVQVLSKPRWDPELNSDLTAHSHPHIPSWAETAADHCAQLDAIRSTQGDVSYEHWRAGAGILKHCEDGPEVAIRWTEMRHLRHNKTNIEHEMQTWNAGPTTCAHFATHNPEGCESCPHNGSVKSPIQLGRREMTFERTIEETLKDGEVITTVIPEFPRGYSFTNDMMCRSVEIEDRIEVVPFSTTLFYARTRIRKEDGKYALSIRAHMPREGVKDFEIDQATLASPTDLQKALAANQIVTTHHRAAGTFMTAYLKDWLEKLKQESDEQRTYSNFGWHENHTSFLVGERLYSADGSVQEVILGNLARSKAAAFPEQLNDLNVWVSAIDEMYNKKGEEHRQYAIASSFGCALTPLSAEENYNGVLFAITGGKTSRGKTTVARSALSVWGDPEKMFFGTENGSTSNALYANLGVYQNLPVLLDEFTHISAEDFSKLCYTVSSGIEKSRMVSGRSVGVTFADTASWRTAPFITANKDLHALLSTRGGSTEAEAVRMIQIHIDEHQMSDDDKLRWQQLTQLVRDNYGTAGDAFAKYIVSHRSEVERTMMKWVRRVADDVPDLKFRFYRGHAECSMAALEICVNLGILKFDVERVYRYVIGLFSRLALDVRDQNTETPEESISQMISDLSSGIAVTQYYRDLRGSNAEADRVHFTGEWHGRAVTGVKGGGDPLAGRLFLSMRSVKMWCAQNRVGFDELVAEMKVLKLWVPMADSRFVLGRGTNKPSGQCRCICIDFFRFENLYGNGLQIQDLLGHNREDDNQKQAGD
jgi:hypothetical protein